MYVIKLKPIIIFIIILIFIFLISFIIFSKSIVSSSTPVSNFLIVIDAGHGNPDGGATSLDGTSEEKINLLISLKLQELLEESNCSTILTRSDENGIYDITAKSSREKKVSDLKNRVKIINEANPTLMVSIHLNKFEDSKYSGWQTFYRKNDDFSKQLASLIQQNLNLSIQKENNRTPLSISDKYIIDNTNCPSVIVECGFLSNVEETNLLKTDEYQNKIAWGIFTGIADYLK